MRMNVKQAFSNGKSVLPFLTCGYPDLETTEQVAYALERAGVGLIVLGIPFSDPTGEGPTLRQASECALENGVTTERVFDLVARIRRNCSMPLAFMTYANVVFSYGTVRFLEQAAKLGVGAIILPDVPFEEKEEFAAVCRQVGVQYISLVAPTSEERLGKIAREAQGFICFVSPCGAREIDTLRQFTLLPVVACGGGESCPGQLAKEAAAADGIFVDSAIMDVVARHGKDAPQAVFDYAKSIVAAVRQD